MRNLRAYHRERFVVPILSLAVLIIFVSGVIHHLGWAEAIKPKKWHEVDYGTLFINLSFAALIVERFLDVFKSIWRRKGRLERLSIIKNAKTENDRRAAQKALDCYRNGTQSLAMYCGYAMGLVIGFSGIRTLQVVYDIHTISGSQKVVFIATDILLTAGLIAGGSKGIYRLTSLIGSFLYMSRQKASIPSKQSDSP
ncbi:MAG: hypothetical protein R6U50_02355 [Desulfobacterales bacterium]